MMALSRLGLGKEKYPTLTGVRALGASVVFFDHFSLWPQSGVVLNVMAFFYTLSGFLIFRIYFERAQLNRQWLTKYFINRYSRIYPVYFLVLTVLVLVQHQWGWKTLLLNYTLTHALFQGAQIILPPSWSLTVEECFYVLAPGLMVLARNRGAVPMLLVGFAMLGAALLIARLPISLLHTPDFVLSSTFFGHFLEFFAGAYVALAVTRAERTSTLHIEGRHRTVIGLVSVMLVGVAMTLVYAHRPFHPHLLILLNNFLIPMPIALLYWGLLRENTVLARLLSSRLAGLLGRSSYSFYLLHAPLIDVFGRGWFIPAFGTRWVSVMVTFVLTWVASTALFLCYEEPLNVYIRNRFHSKVGWVGLRDTLFRERVEPHKSV